jgi:hypothetical protein
VADSTRGVESALSTPFRAHAWLRCLECADVHDAPSLCKGEVCRTPGMPGVAMRRHVQRTASASNAWLTNMLCLSSMTWRRWTWRRGAAWASRSDAGHRSPMTCYTPAQSACQRLTSPLPLGSGYWAAEVSTRDWTDATNDEAAFWLVARALGYRDWGTMRPGTPHEALGPRLAGMKPANVHLLETILPRHLFASNRSAASDFAPDPAACCILRARTTRQKLRVLAAVGQVQTGGISWQTPSRRCRPRVAPLSHACARA